MTPYSLFPQWLQYYGLQKPPFESAWDFESPEQYFFTAPLNKNLHFIHHFLEASVPLIAITGEDGLGKTWMANYLLRFLRETVSPHTFLLDIAPVNKQKDWLFASLIRQLNLQAPRAASEEFIAFLETLDQRCSKIILIIDNIKILHNPAVLEEWRSLINIQPGNRNLFTTLLLTTPKEYDFLSNDLSMGGRVSTRLKLKPLTAEETSDYIHFRLICAGHNLKLFTPEACLLIHQATHGIPLRINLLAQQALMIGAKQFAAQIDVDVVKDTLEFLAQKEGNVRILEEITTSRLPLPAENTPESLESLLNAAFIKKLLIEARSDAELTQQLHELITKAIYLLHFKNQDDVARQLAEALQWLNRGNIREVLSCLKEIGDWWREAGSAA